MLDTIAMGRVISDADYKIQAPELQYQLFCAQKRCAEKKIPLLIQIAGLSGGGRGYLINTLNEWLDNKLTRTFCFWQENDVMRERPEEWRYWMCMPGAGQTAIFYDGWYAVACRDRACGKISEAEFEKKIESYKELERTLTDSGMAIVKIWLHLDKKRFNKIERRRAKSKGLRAYTPYDKELAEHYREHVACVEKMITRTDTVNAPWTLIDASDMNYRNIAAGQTIIEAIDNAIALKELRDERIAKAKPKVAKPIAASASILKRADLKATVDKETYNKELPILQEKLRKLTYEAYLKGISSSLLFEGWDAAGKGSTIRRVLGGLDARVTRVIPTAAPSKEELAHHYLWRFWRNAPAKGRIAIFDRTWYGRVMVERIEKFTPVEDWERGYSEINAVERRWVDNNGIVLKFWLQISPEEQLRRFKERQNTPRKQYKITDEDWRNRDKWGAYEIAVEDMLHKTNTEYAPWIVVPSEDKRYARLFVLRTYIAALKKALKK